MFEDTTQNPGTQVPVSGPLPGEPLQPVGNPSGAPTINRMSPPPPPLPPTFQPQSGFSGASSLPPLPPQPPMRPAPKSGMKRVILIVVIVVLLIGAGIAVALLLPTSNANTNTTNTVTNTTGNTNLVTNTTTNTANTNRAVNTTNVTFTTNGNVNSSTNLNVNRSTNGNTNLVLNTNSSTNLNTNRATNTNTTNLNSSSNTNSVTNTNTPPASYTTDTDNDTLNNYLESWLKTNKKATDSDGDGYLDGKEVTGSFSPLGSGKLTVTGLESYCASSVLVKQYALPSTDATALCGIAGDVLAKIQVMATNATFYEDLDSLLSRSCTSFGKIDTTDCQDVVKTIIPAYELSGSSS